MMKYLLVLIVEFYTYNKTKYIFFLEQNGTLLIIFRLIDLVLFLRDFNWNSKNIFVYVEIRIHMGILI